MLLIEDKLVHPEIAQKHFVCDLKACKGACCVEGEGGAPLEKGEIEFLKDHIDKIKPFLTEEGKAAIDRQGVYTAHPNDEYQRKTTLINGGACAFVNYEKGIAVCGIEKAHEAGHIDFKKPVSCHLYPIRIEKSRAAANEILRFDDWEICDPACKLGEQLKVPLYKFLKDALIRKYGKSFYEGLEATVTYLKSE
ncbi:MAG: DUF3109 family protein [Chitinophagales bacterium]